MIQATILRVSQELDFASREQVNFLLLNVGGLTFRALVDDDTAAAIIKVGLTGVVSVPAPTAVPAVTPSFSPGTAADGSPAIIFGSESTPSDSMLVAETEEQLLRAAPKAPRQSRLMGADERGNPIVEFVGGVDPHAATGPIGDRDEDGVTQL